MKRHIYSPIQLVGFVTLFFLAIFCSIKIYRSCQQFIAQTGITPTLIYQLVLGKGTTLQATDNRTNILILGVAGGTHEGPDLTDTMIVASVLQNNPSISLLSIPRDIWSDTLKDRINSAYHYGEEKKQGGGKTLAKVVVEDVTGLVIHYVVVVDFSQFEELIDVVHGVYVIVPIAFTDSEYPIAGKEEDTCNGDVTYACRYQTIQFQAGTQHMDGSTALKYVRSRHAEGDEGTDFARAKRQQDVIVALKDKIMNVRPWFHPIIATQLLHVADLATDTDMTLGEQLTMGKYLLKVGSQGFSKISIESLLVNPPSWMYGRYVLVPKTDYESIHLFIKSNLKQEEERFQ